MTGESTDIMDMARHWMFRVNDPAFDEWNDFTEWLEADPAHLAAYEAALGEDTWTGDVFARASAANENTPADEAPPRRGGLMKRWHAFAGGAAAAVALVVGLGVWTQGPERYETGPGERQVIALEDGSRVILNGSSAISYDPDSPRFATLERGEALFEIHHDEERPFVVMAGETRLLDAGTVFNVISERGHLEVAVAEGAVIYEPQASAIHLGPGDELIRSSATAAPMLAKTSPEAVGSWQKGILQYTDAPLDEVARDLARNLDKPIDAAPVAKEMRFTGTLAVDGPPDQVLRRVAPLLGVTFIEKEAMWKMTPADGAPR